MPLYEYECAACHRRVEKIQKFSDPELTVCPHCGGALAKTITAPAFHFAGGGWYKDGYGSAKPEAAASSGDAPAAGAAPAAGGATSAAAAAPAAGAAPAAAAAPAATAAAPASKP